MVTNALSPGAWETSRRIYEFETSLVHIASSRTARATKLDNNNKKDWSGEEKKKPVTPKLFLMGTVFYSLVSRDRQ